MLARRIQLYLAIALAMGVFASFNWLAINQGRDF